MKKNQYNYNIRSDWKLDSEKPHEIGHNILKMLDQLEKISVVMGHWRLLDFTTRQAVALADVQSNMTAFVERNVREYDFDPPAPANGYQMIARGQETPSEDGTSRTVDISIDVGSKFDNSVALEIGGVMRPPDSTLVTYPLYRQALEAIVSNWPCPWATAYAFDMHYDTKSPARGVPPLPSTRHHIAWIAFLSAPLAAELTPPPEIGCERTPGGGLILSAVQERLDPANPDHMRRAHALVKILRERVGSEETTPNWGPRTAPF